MGENNNIKNIKLLLMDVDGVLTDGRIVLGEKEELKFFHIQDGMGINMARRAGLKVGVITGRSSKCVDKRAKELKMDFVVQGSETKLKALQKILKSGGMNFENVCYIGDDLNDIPVLERVGFSATVNNAPNIVKSKVNFISKRKGGKGAVREIIEYVLKAQGKLDLVIEEMLDSWRVE
jgi:3-deoxy-D-manno-octulosonate 8-phosphate phosphatase (KDO 8-P phosphatase)